MLYDVDNKKVFIWQELKPDLFSQFTVKHLFAIQTTENLNSWRSLLPGNSEWQWRAFAILAMFVFYISQHLEEHNLFPIHLAAIYLLWYLMHANDPTLIQLHRNGSSSSHQSAITKQNLGGKSWPCHKYQIHTSHICNLKSRVGF